MTSSNSKLAAGRGFLGDRWRLVALGLLIAIAPVAQADPNDPDPPARAGRVVSVVGDAWLFDHDNREWTRLSRNQTVGEGDRLRTDDRARISLRVGSTSLWVDERSDIELTGLDDNQTRVQIDRGDVALRLRSVDRAMDTQLRTREGTVSPEREGLYRVEQLDRGSKVYAWQGRLRFDWAAGRDAAPLWVGEGEQVEFWWPGSPRAERSRLHGDGFGDWVLAESRADGERAVARYVSPEMTGADDLDRYGRWETAPDYGTVWIPTAVVVADWAPYRYGHWAWSRHWGWTWVDDAPWGFAPFHYGRWVQWGSRWCWAPGPYAQRPVYAPALVGWVGGPSINVDIRIGNRGAPPRYGWYPLAPREVFVPAYRHSPAYVGRVNDPRDLRDPVTVQRPHRYRDVPAAVSVLPAAGSAIQPMPVRADRGERAESGEGRWARPLPTAPGRGELGPMLPTQTARPTAPELPRAAVPRLQEPATGWRNEGLPMRRDRAPEPTASITSPNAGTAPLANPGPAAPPGIEAPRRSADLPWRRDAREDSRDPRREDRREDRRDERRAALPEPLLPQAQPQQAPPPQPVQRAMPQPMPERQMERAPERQMERQMERQIERQAERAAEPPRQRAMPFEAAPQRQVQQEPQRMPYSQPQAQPQAQPQVQRAEDRGPQRGRQDGPGRGQRETRENER